MLGKWNNPNLKIKGGESRDLLPFTLSLAREFSGQLGHRGILLASAGQQISAYLRIAHEEQRTIHHKATNVVGATCSFLRLKFLG